MLTIDTIENSDNLRMPRDPKTAAAALRFLQSIELGTAVIIEGNGFVGFHTDGRIIYRSLSGDSYPAKIVAGPTHNNMIDVDVTVPGCAEPVRLTRIRYTKESIE